MKENANHVDGIEIGLLAGLLFWVPRLVGHFLWVSNFTGREVRILTFLLPALTFAGLWIALRIRTGLSLNGLGAIQAIAGIWVLGPLFMNIGWSVVRGEGWGIMNWIVVVLGTALFPIFTYMMSVYDGTLGALAITTTGLIVRAALVPRRLESRDVIILPSPPQP